MGFGYKRAKLVAPQANTERCLVMRKEYALKLLDLLDRGKRIINVDETWLNESNFVRKAWCPTSSSGGVKLQAITPPLSMISALDTEGRVYFSLSHAKTD